MREIKFRAWDKKEKHMIQMNPFNAVPPMMTWDGLYYKDGYLQDVVFMQFTGLKDKNGKEIYEGDLFKRKKGTHDGRISDEDNVRLVRFNHGSFGLTGIYNHGINPLPLGSRYNMENGEVIGNIYENPELLKG